MSNKENVEETNNTEPPIKGKIISETKVEIELDQEMLTCLNGAGVTTTTTVVT